MKTSLLLFLATHLLCLVCAEINLKNVDLSQVNLDGFSAIKEKCDKEGGNGTYDSLKGSPETLKNCLQGFIDYDTFQNELEESKKTGSMDEVFGKYCARRSKVSTCIQTFTDGLRVCLSQEEKKALNITLDIGKQLGEFLCFKDGDRMAMFIAEGGVECIKSRSEGVQNCVNSTLKIDTAADTNSFPSLLLDKKKCDDLGKLQTCVVQELEKCKDSTPANIIDALFRFIKRSACTNKNKRSIVISRIFKRSLPSPSSFRNFTEASSNLLKIIEEKCSRNAQQKGMEAIDEDFQSTGQCLNNVMHVILVAPTETLKRDVQNCLEPLIEKATVCLPQEENYVPRFYLRIFQNLIDFLHANRNKLTKTPTPEVINCFQNFRQENAMNALSQCVSRPEADHITKEVLCKHFRIVKKCFAEEIRKRCIADVTISKLTNDFLQTFTEPCSQV